MRAFVCKTVIIKLIAINLSRSGAAVVSIPAFYLATLLNAVGPTIVGAYTTVSTHGLV
eukprot:COSAG02_NODE_12401_length_1552_cov_1.154852_2_plen_57_part_01